MLTGQQVEKIRKTLPAFTPALASMFDALADQSRFRMFLLVREHPGLCVTDMANILGISVPAVSQQFKILENADLVVRERKGQTTCYLVDEQQPTVKAVMRVLASQKK